MKHLLLFVTLLMSLAACAQDGPAQWQFSAKKVGDRTYAVHLTATIDDPWHVYSQHTPAGGPDSTVIRFIRNPLINLMGAAKEVGDLQVHYEDAFGINVMYYAGKVDFVQTVKVKASVQTTVNGTIRFIVCTDEQCLPPATILFSIALQ